MKKGISKMLSYGLSISLCLIAILCTLTLLAMPASATDNFTTGWLWPVPGVTALSRGYSSSHLGIDISASGIAGKPIVAAKSGWVLKTFEGCHNLNANNSSNPRCTSSSVGCQPIMKTWNPAKNTITTETGKFTSDTSICNNGTGNGITLMHEDGTYSHYAHMQNMVPIVVPGQWVEQGETIGYVGSSGNSSGAHLHFSLSHDEPKFNSTYIINPNPVGSEYTGTIGTRNITYSTKVISSSYLSQCTAYPSYFTVQVSAEAPLWSLPCSDSTNANSTKIIDSMSVGTELTVTATYKNTREPANYWYKATTTDGRTGYVYSARATSNRTFLTDDITITGENYPSSPHTQGEAFPIKGQISSTFNYISTVYGEIRKRNGSVYADNTATISLNKKYYSLSGSEINSAMKFRTLPNGDYTYAVGVYCQNYYSNDGTTLLSSKLPKPLVYADFTVGSGSNLPSAPSAPTVTTSGSNVTVTWNDVANETGYDVYLVQSPWAWADIKYSKTGLPENTRSFTFSNVADGDYKAFVIARPNADSVQSEWTPFSVRTTYTVSYNANGGSGAPAAQTKTHDVALTLSDAVLTRPGYIFWGWAEISDAVQATYPAGGTFTKNANTTLYAVWKAIPSPSNLTISTDKSYYAFGDTVTITPTADNATRYAISVWDGGAYGEGNMEYHNENFTGSVQFIPSKIVTYGVLVNAFNDSGSATARTTFTVTPQATLGATVNAEGSVTLDWGLAYQDAAWYWSILRNTENAFTTDHIIARPSGNQSSWTDTAVEPGRHYYYKIQPIATDGSWAGAFTNTVDITLPSDWLDVNGLLDGELTDRLDGYATVDIYINGELVADDYSDYWGLWPVGTSYEIKDIKPVAGYRFDGLSNLSFYTGMDTQAVPGALSGTLNATITEVVLSISRIPAACTVSFDANGGSGTMAAQTVTEGSSLTLPACAFTAPAGKQFKTWSIGGTEYAVGATCNISADTTVTAVWEDIPATPGSVPLTLTARYSRSARTATVSVVATENITLANYDIILTGGAAFTLTGIENGQPTLFSNFQMNTGTGKVSAMSAGENVTVPAGEILAVYTFTTADKLESGDYPFTLVIEEASDMDATALSWKDKSFTAALTVLPISEESFECRGSKAYTLNFETPAAGDFTLTADKPCIVLYSNGTKYQKLAAAPVEGNTYAFTLPADWDDSAKLVVAMKADFTGDGAITSTDAMQILRCSAGNRTYDELHVLIADINGDGKLTSTDALQVLRVCVELRSLSW